MPTLLLPPRQSPDASALWRAAIRLNWNIIRLQRWAVPDDLPSNDRIILYSGWAYAIAHDLHIHLLEPTLDWLTTVPLEYLHRQVRFTTLHDARSLTTPAFIKPADGKSFPSTIYTTGKDLMPEGILSEETPTLISDIVEWQLEFRCFILNRRVMTLSPYLRNRQLAESPTGEWPATPEELEAARAFAQKVLDDPRTQIPPAVTLDVGLLSTGQWAVIETNAAWGSGIYGCDPEWILPVLSRACVPAAELTDDDRRWLIERAADPF